MKKILLSVLLLGAVFFSNAQGGITFGAGAAFGIPTGDLKESHDYGYGLEAQGTMTIAENINAFVQGGVSVYKVKSSYGGANDNGTLHIPVLVGANYSLGGVHVGAGVGYGIWSASGGSGSFNGFTYSPQVGYKIDKFDFLANYTATSTSGGTLSYFGIKVFRLF